LFRRRDRVELAQPKPEEGLGEGAAVPIASPTDFIWVPSASAPGNFSKANRGT
jgi:hypothetical protein